MRAVDRAEKGCFVVGCGAVSPAGLGADLLWQAVVDGQPKLVTGPSGHKVGSISDATKTQLKQSLVDDQTINNLQTMLPWCPIFEAQEYTIAAMNEAMAEAGWQNLGPDDGLIMATTTGQIPLWEKDLVDYLQQKLGEDELAVTFRQQTLGLTMSQLSMALEFAGKNALVTSACAASTQALVLAKKWLELGLVRRVLVGATELMCSLTLKGFDSFQLLSPEVAQPFDRDRKGINLAEGSAFLCLEAGLSDRVLAQIKGGGTAVDAYHMTAPEPGGKGCALAMRMALADAQLDPGEIGWVHAHGTGSLHNDVAESRAIADVLGADVPVSSTKAIHGHPLAAAGILETVIDVMAVRHQVQPGTAGFSRKDETVEANILGASLGRAPGWILKNTLGFGGTNASLVIG